jgi:hypothetical protein
MIGDTFLLAVHSYSFFFYLKQLVICLFSSGRCALFQYQQMQLVTAFRTVVNLR